MKGVSHIISALLLLTFTIVAGGLFSQWAPYPVKSSQDEASNSSGEICSCAGVTFDMIDADGSEVTFQQSGGERSAGNASVTWSYQEGSIARSLLI